MKVAPVYRTVLKSLKRACTTRPHFVQDVRFLLSLPLFTANEEHTVVPGTTATATTMSASPLPGAAFFGKATQASPVSDQQEEAEAPTLPPHRTTTENYLSRPASACHPIDAVTLFDLCHADVLSAVRQPIQTDNGVNPVAQQILRYRNLLWLKGRLERALSDKTTQQLATSLSVAEGPTNDDFIPDTFFEVRGSALLGNSGGGDPPNAAAAAAVEEEEDSPNAASASTPASDGSAGMARFGVIASAASDEADADVVHSAGAMGMVGEMFVLRHREPFPMAAHFLSGSPTVPAAELASCAHQQASLVRLVRDRFPTTVTCEDANVSLSVAVEPFDVQYRSREHAGVGYFATAHRQFRVQFSVEPLSLGAADGVGERTEVLLVNSYFVRLDMEAMQVVEEVGYLHSRDVLRMLRQRDYDDHYSDYISGAVAEVLGEGEGSQAQQQTSASESPTASEAPPAVAATTTGGTGRVFSLYFVNPTDAPMVLKGMLYYKVGKRKELATAPIQCIPFGFVLLEA